MDRLSWIVIVLLGVTAVHGEEHKLHKFKEITLTDEYYSEGANAGDLDGDGMADAVYGPDWYKGPEFVEKHILYPAKEQNKKGGWADNFFNWEFDFNNDGRKDIFTVGFPGTPAYVYENPGPAGFDKEWPKHKVFDSVTNEAPQFINIVGDERPEFLCTNHGSFGYATVDWEKPFAPWTFHSIADKKAADRFGHGLGAGDINGDGRTDILMQEGWFEQPESLADDAKWPFHDFTFAKAGGAEMFAYDVDGDGDNDVITSLAAHDFGLAWFEQVRDGDAITFKRHMIMNKKPEDNKYGVVFSELHSVALADIDGDGLKDIITGKTYWSHHMQAPQWDAGAVVYWFKLARTDDGVDWVPYRAADDCGIGRQVSIVDVNNDSLPDIVLGGMKGGHVLIHHCETVSDEEWKAAQPQPLEK